MKLEHPWILNKGLLMPALMWGSKTRGWREKERLRIIKAVDIQP